MTRLGIELQSLVDGKYSTITVSVVYNKYLQILLPEKCVASIGYDYIFYKIIFQNEWKVLYLC